MAEAEVPAQMTRDLKDAVSAILQGYGSGQRPVTDASAELHRLCGCLERMLQFEQKEQKRFLRARRNYWDFLCTALSQQRGDTESCSFVHSQDKLQTPLGRGRAFIRFCLVHGQLAESLQLCLLDPGLTREWYGPRSPLLCPPLQEDLLDSLYTLNGVTFNLDLQRTDLDEDWPMFSESSYSNTSHTLGRRPRKTKESPKQVRKPKSEGVQVKANGETREQSEDPGSLGTPQKLEEAEGEQLQQDSEKEGPRKEVCLENSTPHNQAQEPGVSAVLMGIRGVENTGVLPSYAGRPAAEGAAVQRLPAPSPRGTRGDTMPERGQEREVCGISGEPRVLRSLGTSEESITEKSRESSGTEEPAAVGVQAEVQGVRTPDQALQQLLTEREGRLRALEEQLSRCQEEKAQLQAQLGQVRLEAERKVAMSEEELGQQRDLVQAMKRRVLELIQEKDSLWQKAQQVSSVAPGRCVGCSKIFSRLSRRYPCRLCGGLVCHACSGAYKKRACCCPPCAQSGDIQGP